MDASSKPVSKAVHRRSHVACDACKARKVKCVYDGTVCQMCRDLEIPCTQTRPRKRRGPVNRCVRDVANCPCVDIPRKLAYSSAKVDLGAVNNRADLFERYVQALSLSNSPAGSAVSFAPESACGLDQLAPFTVVEQIVHKWFDTFHSVCPIFHHGTFLKRLYEGDAAHDHSFCALVVSMCAITYASLRRSSPIMFGAITVQKCLEVFDHITLQEGRQKYTLEWCQARYNFVIALAAERAFDDEDVFRFLGEAVTGVKYLIYYELSNMSFLTQQLLMRLYCLLFAATCTMDLHGRPYVGLLSPKDNINDFTPLEITDDELDATHVHQHQSEHWHGNTKSYIPGLNHLSQLFLLWHKSQQGDNKTFASLRNHQNLVHRALDYLPPELKWRGGLSKHPDSNFGTTVQTANLYLTQLHIRSNLLEQMIHLSATSTTPETSTQILNEQQSVVDDMLEILYAMPEEALEANGHSLLRKIRDIGSGLLDVIRTGVEANVPESRSSENLRRLLAKLESLDVPPQISEGGSVHMITP